MAYLAFGLILFSSLATQAHDDSKLSLGRRVLMAFDKTHVDWIDSTIKKYNKDICGEVHPELSREGFEHIRKQAEKVGDRCYAFSNLPRGIGIDFSSYQNLSEEFFFDSLIQAKMASLACKETSINCLNEKRVSTKLANDFVDRLDAFKIYRDKFKNYDPEKGKIPNLSESEKKILERYFPGQTENIKDFFDTWNPVSAINIIVNYQAPGADRGFLFQEAFATLAQEEKNLHDFGKLNREQQVNFIRDLVKGTSANQKKAIAEEKSYWERSCRPNDTDIKNKSNCFYRPTYQQKRKLLNDYSLAGLFSDDKSAIPDSTKYSLQSFGKQEQAFLCKLNIRYGKGGDYFDAKMTNITTALAVIPVVRALIGAVAARSVTASLLTATASRHVPLHQYLTAAETVGKFSAVASTATTMHNIYTNCTAQKFKSVQQLPFVELEKSKKFRSQSEFLADCKSCKIHPKAKQTFDISCVKEATKWAINKSIGTVSAVGYSKLVANVAQDNSGNTPITTTIGNASDAISVFLYNLSLTTSLDVPSLSDFQESMGK